jgi:transcriptional regulator with GAF, ATPase, and Fis domain
LDRRADDAGHPGDGTPAVASSLLAEGTGEISRLARRRLDLRQLERQYIGEVLAQTRWRIDGPKGAAARLGLPPSTLRSRMKKLGIS